MGWFLGGVKGVELAVEDSGDVALEGSADFAAATAFLGSFGDVVPCSGVADHPGQVSFGMVRCHPQGSAYRALY